LLFAVHPVHVEAIANISHRKEPLALLFYILGFLAYLEARAERPHAPLMRLWSRLFGDRGTLPARIELAGWAMLCYLLAMLSKDVGGVMLPLVVVVYELVLAPGRLGD